MRTSETVSYLDIARWYCIQFLSKLANTDELNVKLSHEHTNYMWVNFDEASEQLTFDQEINLLGSAKDFLNTI